MNKEPKFTGDYKKSCEQILDAIETEKKEEKPNKKRLTKLYESLLVNGMKMNIIDNRFIRPY